VLGYGNVKLCQTVGVDAKILLGGVPKIQQSRTRREARELLQTTFNKIQTDAQKKPFSDKSQQSN